MGSLSTRRVIGRSTPAKITIVEGKGCGGNASEKENIMRCSLYSMFQTHYGRVNNSPSKAPSQESADGMTDKVNIVLQPKRRLLINRAVAPVAEYSRELAPPELTTSDTFKPAKRTLAPTNVPGDEGFKQLPLVRIPGPITSESCDVLVSSPTEWKNTTTPDLINCRVMKSGRRDVTKKPPTHRRRFSILRLSIAREGAALHISKKDGNPVVKKSAPTAKFAVGYPTKPDGKEIVFSAHKRTPFAEPSNRVQTEAERARVRVLDRRNSVGHKMTSLGKQGIGSFGGRSDVLKKNCAEKVSLSAPQLTNLAWKDKSESIRTRRLARVLNNERRLAVENEQNRIKLQQIQAQVEERDLKVEKLRSAALMLNNLINRQGDEIMKLRFRLKEICSENAKVRHVCDTLARDLRKTRESLRLERLQQVFAEPYEPSLVSLTSQLQSMTICMEPPVIQLCIEEGQEDSESQEESKDNGDYRYSEDPEADGIAAESKTTIKNGQATQFTLQDLQEMVTHEEDLLKERCFNALRELNLPLTPLLTSKGSLDVGSLKAMLVTIPSKDEHLTPERISSIRKLTAWLGLS